MDTKDLTVDLTHEQIEAAHAVVASAGGYRIELIPAMFAALAAQGTLVKRAAAQSHALGALQKLDFNLRAEGGEGLPAEACTIIDGALASNVTVAELIELLQKQDQAAPVQYLIVSSVDSAVLQMDLRSNLVDVQKVMQAFKKPAKKSR